MTVSSDHPVAATRCPLPHCSNDISPQTYWLRCWL